MSETATEGQRQGRLATAARNAAYKALAEQYPDSFHALLAREREARGLVPVPEVRETKNQRIERLERELREAQLQLGQEPGIA